MNRLMVPLVVVIAVAHRRRADGAARWRIFSTDSRAGVHASGGQGRRRRDVDLKATLAKGPVGCTSFRSRSRRVHDRSPQVLRSRAAVHRLGATVIGVSSDDIATQKRFSTEECRSASWSRPTRPQGAKKYDAFLAGTYAIGRRTSSRKTHDRVCLLEPRSLEARGEHARPVRALEKK